YALAAAANAIDGRGIDRGLDGLAGGVLAVSEGSRKIQSGKVRSYALITLLGVALVGVLMIIGQLG
ncbi:MAG: hypothetical protein LBQ92_02840, partial [Propionibacteriaceae bacterium]|nr:hypothetical protein [Propionibacteriaceae bacterium]